MVNFNQAMFMFKYTNGLLSDSFKNIFDKLGNFDRSLSYQVDLLKFSSLQTFPSYTLLKGSILGIYMGVWTEPYRQSRFMSSLFN